MTYKKQLDNILNNKSIWGKKFKIISVSNIVKAKIELNKIDPISLRRIMSMLEDIKVNTAHSYSKFIGNLTISLATITIILTLFASVSDIPEQATLFFVILSYVNLYLHSLFFRIYQNPKDVKFNNKIKCIEIAITEILQYVDFSSYRYKEELDKELKVYEKDK